MFTPVPGIRKETVIKTKTLDGEALGLSYESQRGYLKDIKNFMNHRGVAVGCKQRRERVNRNLVLAQKKAVMAETSWHRGGALQKLVYDYQGNSADSSALDA